MTTQVGAQTSEHPTRLMGTRGSQLAYAIRDFLQRSDVPFEWTELSSDDEAREKAKVSGLRDRRLPVCVLPDGTRLECPTIRQIIEKLGWFHDPSRKEYDLAILGGGPAGLSAAVYGASEGLKTVLIERWVVGGQAGTTSKIENYLGFPEGICGADLAQRARDQACKFGAEILLLREGVRAEFQTGRLVGYLADGTKIVMHAGVCATGVEYRRLGLPSAERLYGRGVYYGAGVSEASLCVNEDVYVVGGGNSAGQAALHFANFARKVFMVIRGDGLKETVSQYLIDRIKSSPKIEVLTRTEVTGLLGDLMLEAITLTNNQTAEKRTVKTANLFLCLGGVPNTQWADEAGIICDEQRYLVTGPDLREYEAPDKKWPLDRAPYYLETNQPGLFAAGDVRHSSVKRCASAVGEGAMAVTFVHRYLANQ